MRKFAISFIFAYILLAMLLIGYCIIFNGNIQELLKALPFVPIIKTNWGVGRVWAWAYHMTGPTHCFILDPLKMYSFKIPPMVMRKTTSMAIELSYSIIKIVSIIAVRILVELSKHFVCHEKQWKDTMAMFDA